MAWFRAATGVARHALRRSLIARATAGTCGTRSAGFGTSALSRSASAPAPARRAFPLTTLTDSFLDGTSSVYLEQLQRAGQANPSSVDESWDNLFGNLLGQAATSAGLSGQTIQERIQQLLLVRAYQVNGHMKARLDDRCVLEGFDLINYGFSESDLDREFFLSVCKIFGLFENRPVLTLRVILSKLNQKHSEIDEPSSSQPTKKCKAIAAQAMGHPVLMFGSSSLRTLKSKRLTPLGACKRTFSSMGEQAPVVSQLMCHDEYDIKHIKWRYLADCIIKGGNILKPMFPNGLMREEDVIKCGGYQEGALSVCFFRQGAGLIAVNKMRGLNVHELMKLENLLWSPERRCLRFKECNLSGDCEASPYKALYDSYDKALELSTGYSLNNLPHRLPRHVVHFLCLLLDASNRDKRLITNHSATRFAGERIQRKKALNHLLHVRLPYEFGPEGSQRARAVLAELGRIFPLQLLTDGGMQPGIDYWARKATELRGDYNYYPGALSPVVGPVDDYGNELFGWNRLVGLGRILVALNHNPFEHLKGPISMGEPFCSEIYDLVDVENLLNGFMPGYLPIAESACLVQGLENVMETDSKNRPFYESWTDLSSIVKVPLKDIRSGSASFQFSEASTILQKK